jgi:hypothetical protein
MSKERQRLRKKRLFWQVGEHPFVSATRKLQAPIPESWAEFNAMSRDEQMRALDQVYADHPEQFERCDKDGTSNPNGVAWKLRDAQNCH